MISEDCPSPQPHLMVLFARVCFAELFLKMAADARRRSYRTQMVQIACDSGIRA